MTPERIDLLRAAARWLDGHREFSPGITDREIADYLTISSDSTPDQLDQVQFITEQARRRADNSGVDVSLTPYLGGRP
jgi:hypothetical protein